MKLSSKTEITTENVDALVDQYADTWAFARDIEEMFADCSTKSIGYWRDLGKLRSREVERKQRQPWVQWNVADVIVARRGTRKDETFLRRMMKDGSCRYRCTKCKQWKGEDGFFNDGRPTGYGKFTRCKKCRHDIVRELRKNEHVKRADRERFKKVYAERKQMKEAAAKWKAPKRVATSIVVAMVDARYGRLEDKPTDRELEERAGVPQDYLRSLRHNNMTSFDRAEALLIGLGMDEEARELVAIRDKDKPMWHPQYESCVKCHRNDKTYTARGMCSTCYRHRNDPAHVPATGTWSLRYDRCRECKRSNVGHAGRGLCHACYYRPNRRRVGSGHGNPQSSQAT